MAQTTLFNTAPKPRATDSRKADCGAQHARIFPMKSVKAAVRVEERVVCVMRAADAAGDWRYLVEQRPHQGLLAGLWEFPTAVADTDAAQTQAGALQKAREHAQDMAVPPLAREAVQVERVHEAHYFGHVRHVFSHLIWAMHVVRVDVSLRSGDKLPPFAQPTGAARPARWLSGDGVHAATMGTGMRRCWELVAFSDRNTKSARG